jgi:hypothetical protein
MLGARPTLNAHCDAFGSAGPAMVTAVRTGMSAGRRGGHAIAYRRSATNTSKLTPSRFEPKYSR